MLTPLTLLTICICIGWNEAYHHHYHPATTCGPCAIRCATGFMLDTSVCPCTCVPRPPTCPCALFCRKGFVQDRTVCPCRCIPACPCTLFCRKGFVQDRTVCPCRCIPSKACPCTLFCRQGFVQDHTVCPCRCIPDPDVDNNPCSFTLCPTGTIGQVVGEVCLCVPIEEEKVICNIDDCPPDTVPLLVGGDACTCQPKNATCTPCDRPCPEGQEADCSCQCVTTNAISTDCLPPKPPRVFCFVEPCRFATCPAHPNATCVDNYCGGCFADFFVDGNKVNCQNSCTGGGDA